MNKRADKSKRKLALVKPGASARNKNTPKRVRAGITKVSSVQSDPHDPLLVQVRHTYAQRVCHPHRS